MHKPIRKAASQVELNLCVLQHWRNNLCTWNNVCSISDNCSGAPRVLSYYWCINYAVNSFCNQKVAHIWVLISRNKLSPTWNNVCSIGNSFSRAPYSKYWCMHNYACIASYFGCSSQIVFVTRLSEYNMLYIWLFQSKGGTHLILIFELQQ